VWVIGKYMEEKILKMVYLANFKSVMKYGVNFWERHSLIQSVFLTQKRAVRIVKKKKYLESCKGELWSLDIMTVHAIYVYECLLFLH